MHKYLITLLIGVIVSTVSATEVYRVERPDGTVEFTDEPRLGADKVKIPKIQSYSPPPVSTAPKKSKPAAKTQQKSIKYNSVNIISPAPEETLFHNGDGMLVGISIDPALQQGHEIVIIIDGGEMARGSGTNFMIKDIFRGSHSVKALIEDNKGRIVKSSDSVTFYMRQHRK